MNLLVATEHHFQRTPDGAIWAKSMFTNSYWRQYLDVFRHVRVLARVKDTPSIPSDWNRVDSQEVSFAPVPDYRGPRQYLLRVRQVYAAARQAFQPRDAVILYNGRIGTSILAQLRRSGHPYGIYVIGDPQDVFAPGTMKHPARPFFHWYFPRLLRRQCSGACAVAYVSKQRLQQRYPPRAGAFTTYFPMQGLGREWFVSEPHRYAAGQRSFTLISVGSLAQLYKGTDVLIDAVADCVRKGLDLKLIVVGEGKHRPELEARAAARGLGQRVYFRGQLSSGAAIRAELDQADLFVMPSRAEALGLAFIEAMARGLPCIGSNIGGIPEYLPTADLVPPDDVTALSSRLHAVVTDPGRMTQMAARNLARAGDYHETVIRERQNHFYQYVHDQTANWLNGRQ